MMEELEYHVTFPAKFSHDAADASQESDTFGDKEPVIFLLGWYGCQDKHLAKYSAIYQSKGYTTIRYTMPPQYLFSGRQGEIKGIAIKVLESFFDLGLEGNPIFFHVFSNGGGYIYRFITDILNGPNVGQFAALKIAGVVFDSAPCNPTFLTGFKAVLSAQPPSQHWLVAFLKTVLFWVGVYIYGLLPKNWESNRLRLSYMQSMCDDKLSCPSLVLYSKADSVCSYGKVREFIQLRRKRGYDVREVLWEDSEHVGHLLKHREEYMDACLDFITIGVKMVDRD